VTFLLDTSVVSEWVKPRPNPHVVRWLADADEDRAFISVVSFAEIRHGIERLPQGRRREQLTAWLTDDMPARFEGRILAIDQRVAETWGVVLARGQRAGVAVGAMDALFAATAEAHGLALVTLNVHDFARLGVPLLDPSNVDSATTDQ
jgi:predicted nucleic acid-binding protein